MAHSKSASIASAHHRRRLDVKNISFDEDNIRETTNLVKDYGTMLINESKTPYPQISDPVDAELLRIRLKASMVRANAELFETDSEIRMGSAFTLDVSPNFSHSLSRPPFENFNNKRKRNRRSEFTITKQRLMSETKHPPGPVIRFAPVRASDFGF